MWEIAALGEGAGTQEAVGPTAFRAAAKRAKWKIQGPKACFLVEGEDRLGAMVTHAHRLAITNVNIHAAAAVGGGAGRYGVILWVKPKDVKKAARALEAEERG